MPRSPNLSQNRCLSKANSRMGWEMPFLADLTARSETETHDAHHYASACGADVLTQTDRSEKQRKPCQRMNRTGILGGLISWEDGVYGTSKSVCPGGT